MNHYRYRNFFFSVKFSNFFFEFIQRREKMICFSWSLFEWHFIFLRSWIILCTDWFNFNFFEFWKKNLPRILLKFSKNHFFFKSECSNVWIQNVVSYEWWWMTFKDIGDHFVYIKTVVEILIVLSLEIWDIEKSWPVKMNPYDSIDSIESVSILKHHGLHHRTSSLWARKTFCNQTKDFQFGNSKWRQ